jgi:hypothetical protein
MLHSRTFVKGISLELLETSLSSRETEIGRKMKLKFFALIGLASSAHWILL